MASMAQTITGSAYLRSIDSAKGRVREIDISGVIRVQDATLVDRFPVQIRRRKLGAVLQDVIEPRYRLTEIVTRRRSDGRVHRDIILRNIASKPSELPFVSRNPADCTREALCLRTIDKDAEHEDVLSVHHVRSNVWSRRVTKEPCPCGSGKSINTATGD